MLQIVERQDARPLQQQLLEGVADRVEKLIARVALKLFVGAEEALDGGGQLGVGAVAQLAQRVRRDLHQQAVGAVLGRGAVGEHGHAAGAGLIEAGG